MNSKFIFSVAFTGILFSGCMEPSEISQSPETRENKGNAQPEGITQKNSKPGFGNDAMMKLSPQEIENLKPGHLEYLKMTEGTKPKVSAGLAKTAVNHTIGLLERPDYHTCSGSDLIRISMDDEANGNGSSVYSSSWYNPTWVQHDLYGRYGVRAVSGEDTEFRFCKVSVSSSYLHTKYDYAFLRVESSCPSGTYPFARTIDNEDVNNANSNSGNISPSTQSGAPTHGWTRLEFCFVPGNGTNSNPVWNYDYATIGAKEYFPGGGCYMHGYALSDDEDDYNINAFDWYGMSQANIDKVSAFFWATPHTTYFYAAYCDGPVGG